MKRLQPSPLNSFYMKYTCCSEERRELVKGHPTLNGIDFLEVVDNPSDPDEVRQTVLLVHFIKDISPGAFTKEQVIIEGGERITNIQVIDLYSGFGASPPSSPPLSPPTGDPSRILCVNVNTAGDFSTYTLRLINNPGNPSPPPGIDPILASVEFSFKASCPDDFDCKTTVACDEELQELPNINYLAKDYASFRKLMLERLALLLPGWQEQNPADLGVTLVELLAYVGDHLSYQQDAVATEAYIGTARKRVSVKRHARMVDYYMHDGSNARCWVQVQVKPGGDGMNFKRGSGISRTKFITSDPDFPRVITFNSELYEDILQKDIQIFEPLHDITLYSDHNVMYFHTWGDRECCLPKGAKGATLQGKLENLKVGDVLILAEVKGPETGVTEDADPAHRHAVRITRVGFSEDPLGAATLLSPPASHTSGSPLPITNIEWHDEDALPFPLCISSREGNQYFENVGVAWGNIVLADHGLSAEDSTDSTALSPVRVPRPNPVLSPKTEGAEACEEKETELLPPRYRPEFTAGVITQAAGYSHGHTRSSVTSVMDWDLKKTIPMMTLEEESTGLMWEPRRDLLNSNRNSRHFVVEVEKDGTARLRFGDNKHGMRPPSGTVFKTHYRLGNGTAGNIGAGKLGHLVSDDATVYSNPGYITKVWNPLPARGGAEPEGMEEVRQKAGHAFRQQKRAVTPDDYAKLAKASHPDVQRTAATYRWTGSWYTNFLTFDRFAGRPVDQEFENDMVRRLDQYRMAGEDLEVDAPRFVPLEVEMTVCLEEGYYAAHVKSAILAVFNNRYTPDGSTGLFHPDRFTFGQTLYLSTYYAAAQAIPGVETLEFTKFQRWGNDNSEMLRTGKLILNRLEIARLDNDPNFKERGVFNVLIT